MSKIELEQISENEVEVIFPPETPMEMVQQLVKGLADRGLIENLQKSTLGVRYFERPIDKANTVADELIKSLSRLAKDDELPYWHPKSQFANQKRVREMDVADRRAKLGIKQPTNVSTQPEPHEMPDTPAIKPPSPSAPSVNTAPQRYDTSPTAMTTAGGTGKRYAFINDPVSQSEHVEGCQCDKCLAMEKSGYGPKKGGQYSATDNARRKANNTGDQTGFGANSNTKAYTSAKFSNQTPQTDPKLKKPQPIKSLKAGTLNPSVAADIMARANGVKKSAWADHLPFPNAEEEMRKASRHAPQTAEDIMANQLATMMNGKAMLGQAPPSQPTDEQLFGGGVVTDEMAKAQDAKWNNTMNWLQEATKPISQRFSSQEEEEAYWTNIRIGDRDDGQSGY